MRRRFPLRVLAVSLVLPASRAFASDFGCVAEWLDLALVPAALPMAGLGLWAALRLPPGRAAAGAGLVWLVCAGLVAATGCAYGNDADGVALAAVSGALGITLLAAAWRARSSRENG
jgi:hypothetical protein